MKPEALIRAAIRDNNPVLYLEHKFLYRRVKEAVPEEGYLVPPGQALLWQAPVGRPGGISVIAYGAMVWVALEAAGKLADQGIRVLYGPNMERICLAARGGQHSITHAAPLLSQLRGRDLVGLD